MVIYAKDAVGDAWQYTGEIESMPDWARESSDHHIEVDKDGAIQYWSGNEHMRVHKGDWFVMFCDGTTHLWDDYAFKSSFTFSDPSHCKTDPVIFPKYKRCVEVDAWQYTGELNLSTLPSWVADLILHHKLGYHSAYNPVTNSDAELFELYYEDVWVPIIKSDWLVRYNEDTFYITSDDDFKEFFEEIK